MFSIPKPMMWPLALAAIMTLSGCAKLEEVRRKKADNPVPSTPFSVDCTLTGYMVGGTSGSAPREDPATIRLQVNPLGRYYKVINYRGQFPDVDELYRQSEDFQKSRNKNIGDILGTPISWVPFIGSGGRTSTQVFRVDATNAHRLFLEEANEFQFREQSGGALEYMMLDVRERKLTLGYETRAGLTYDHYLQHGEWGPAVFWFACARSPRGTVIEVDGFNQ